MTNALVVLDCMEILPQHGGRGLGSVVAARVIDRLASHPLILVATCPMPL